MAKSTPAGVERDLGWSLGRFKERAYALKDAHRVARQKIQNDPMLSDLAKQTGIADLNKDTRVKLDMLRGEQGAYVRGLRDKIERELVGNQPTDASSVLLRRDAADRARKIVDEKEALAVLGDAARGGDDTLVDAVGYRARHAGWINVVEAYKEARPGTSDSAVALAYVEGLDSDPGYNLANGITYSAPSE